MRLPHDGVGRDHDSVGMFQQRPSWGPAARLLDPRYSSAKFYERLLKVDGWERMRLTDAAQLVQVSAFPGAYQKWEQLAALLVAKIAGDDLSDAGGAPLCAAAGQVSSSGWTVPAQGSVGSGFRTASRPTHNGVDLIAARGSPIRAAAAGIVITVICQASNGTCDSDGGPAVTGCGWYVEVAHGANVWTRYCHMGQRPSVVVGQRVQVGEVLGLVGSSGNSSGPHLHFEVHLANDAIDPVPFMAGRGAPLDGGG
jgi:murein DD-endopeptidase MepM/ murein hydrolase activator NlpD